MRSATRRGELEYIGVFFCPTPEYAMATIRVERSHQLGREAVRDKVEALAARLAREYQLRCQWRGDRLDVERSGVKGHIAIDERAVRIELSLGLLLSAMRGPLQSEIESALDRELA